MPENPIVEISHIYKSYSRGGRRIPVLEDITFNIAEGEFLALMGPSGSGKSTLLNILGCLARPTSGAYILDGEDVSHMDKVQLAAIRNLKLGYVFQSYNLLPRTTALRNVILPLIYDRTHKFPSKDWEERARNMLAMVGLGDRMNHMPQELSGGQQQRVAIARALINDPVVIIADEPTGNLDSRSGEEIMLLFDELHKQEATIVIVTHDPVVAAHTERTIHLKDGHVDTIVHNGKNHPGVGEKEVKHATS